MRRRPTFVLFAAFILFSSLTAIAWYWRSPGPRLPVETRLTLIEQMNEALGYVENGDFAKAIPVYRQIVKEVPDERLGHRNLCVALFSPDDFGRSTHKNQKALDELLVSIQQLLELDNSSSVSYLLAGRAYQECAELARARGDIKEGEYLDIARSHYQRSANLEPLDPAPLFHLYQLEKTLGDPQRPSEEAQKALLQARGRAANSLVLLLESLEILSFQSSEVAIPLLKRAIQALPPDAGHISDTLRTGLGNPNSIYGAVVTAHNQVKSAAAYQRELARLQPHPLGFTLADFSPNFYAGLPDERLVEIPVEFVSNDSLVPSIDSTCKWAGHADLDTDGQPEFLGLFAEEDSDSIRLECPMSDGKIPPIPSFHVSGNYDKVEIIDLDLDIRAGKEKNIAADPDLTISGPSGVRIVENLDGPEGRQWADRTEESGISVSCAVNWIQVCDIDHDGNLDIIVGLADGIRVIRNAGNWKFTDITARSDGLDISNSKSGCFGDFDRDGDTDLFIINEESDLVFIENQRSGRLAAHPPAFTDHRCGLPTRVMTVDADNDGRLDLVTSQTEGASFYLAAERSLLPKNARVVKIFTHDTVKEAQPIDFDNDGGVDLLIRTNRSDRCLRLFRNMRNGTFEDRTPLLPMLETHSLQTLVVDADEDGDQDIISISPTGCTALSNEGGNQNQWINLQLRAFLNRDPGVGLSARCNYSNIGGVVELRAGRHYQLQQITRPNLHFGLGNRSRADMLRVFWTNGSTQAILRPEGGQQISEDQRPKGSCPFLFAWNGESYQFITDCLWASDLGLISQYGGQPDVRKQHNYLRIAPDQLDPIEGKYSLSLTNELWEIPYIDQIELWAIDHATDATILTNQAAPAEVQQPFELRPVRDLQPPIQARDHRGRDVLHEIEKKDGNCLGGFTKARYRGLAEPHWVEVDLGQRNHEDNVTVCLTGWLRPTDTTANVALSQIGKSPEGIALSIPDGSGGWKVEQPNVGFPAGFMQTLVLDIPRQSFPRRDYRIRLTTNMEMYWDEIVSAKRVEAPMKLHRGPSVQFSQAQLQYRGYSTIENSETESPPIIHYDDFDSRPRWLPVGGKFTRFGNVQDLLLEEDDKYIIMSPGDELQLKFDALPLPATGLNRTFIVHISGWLKGFDFNGPVPQTVGPLPYERMQTYPYPSSESPAQNNRLVNTLKRLQSKREPLP